MRVKMDKAIAQQRVLTDIQTERERQDDKWGDQSLQSDAMWNVIATEEVGEVAREIYEHGNNLYGEIIQSAAVYIAWAEALWRRDDGYMEVKDEEYC